MLEHAKGMEFLVRYNVVILAAKSLTGFWMMPMEIITIWRLRLTLN
jgi:hypothetical protein